MLLRNGLVLDKDFNFNRLDVLIDDGRFLAISPKITSGQTAEEADVVDLDGGFVVPGLVDIHVHGAGGDDYSNADQESLGKIARELANMGTTSFVATSLSMDTHRLLQLYTMTANYLENQQSGCGAAMLSGIHMEGPYLCVAKRGAHDERYLRLPDIEEVSLLQKASGNAIKIITIAPELPGAMELIRVAASAENDLPKVLSIGHTDCDYRQARMAFEAGASHITHLYNGMRPFHHREPGILGALAENTGVTAELICDGLHVHPASARMALQLAGEDRIILISDGLAPMGCVDMPQRSSEFNFGERKLVLRNGAAELEDGTLAGSLTGLYQCVKNAIQFGFDVATAFKAATLNPAKRIGMANEIGSIAVGKKADFLILDRNLNLSSVYIGGKNIRTADQS